MSDNGNVYLKDGRIKSERNDCSVIALSYACDLDYQVAHAICKKEGRKDRDGFSLLNVFPIRKGSFGMVKLGGKKFTVSFYDRPKMNVKRFIEAHPIGTYCVRVGGHVFCLKDGKKYNQASETQVVSYYHKVKEIK